MLCLLESADNSGMYIMPCIESDGAHPPQYSLRHLVLLLGYSHQPNSHADAWMLYWQTPEHPCLSIYNHYLLVMRPYEEDKPGMISTLDPLWYIHNEDAIGFTAMDNTSFLICNLAHSIHTGCIAGLVSRGQSDPQGLPHPFSFRHRIIELINAENLDKLKQILKNKGENEKLDLSGPYNNSDGSWSPAANGLIDFTGLDLSEFDFSNSRLRYVKFKNCNLTGAKFNNATFIQDFDYTIDFSGATLTNIDFTNCDLTKVNFDSGVSLSKAKAILHGATFPFRLVEDLKWDGLDLGGAKVLDLPQQISSKKASLSAKNANLQGTFKDRQGLNLSYANFTGANLQDNDLADADLTGATLDDCRLQGTTLTGIKLVDVSMKGAILGTEDNAQVHTSLQGALLQQVKLEGVHLKNVYMAGAQFYGSYNYANGIDLTNADLSGANLSQIDLSAVNLNTGARLEKANLDSANLIGAKLNYANLANATLHAAYLQGADFTGAVMTAANLAYSSVCLADTDSTVLGVPLFAVESSAGLIQALDSGNIKGAGLQTIFANNQQSQNWQSLGTPTLTASIKGSRWILEAAAAVYKQVQNSKMTASSGYLSYTLELRAGKVFVLGRDFWCTATVVSTNGSPQTQQKAVYLKGSTQPQGITPGTYDIKDIGATTLPSTLDDGVYCPNGQTVAENREAGNDEWYWMMAPEPPAPPKCVPNPTANHYCPK